MKFTVQTNHINNFKSELKTICKKFKVSYDVEISDAFVIGHFETVGKKIPIYGSEIYVYVPEIEKMHDTGYTYLGCIKNDDDIITVHPTDYAEEKEVNLSTMENEIKTFPCEECGKKISRKIIHVFEKDEKVTVYGSGCAIKKFGIDLENVLQRFISAMESVGKMFNPDSEFFSFSYEKEFNYHLWISLCFHNIYKTGYVSRSKAEENGGSTTAESTKDDYVYIENLDNRKRGMALEIINDDLEKIGFNVDDFLNWLPSLKEKFTDDTNDFHYNINNVIDKMIETMIPERMNGFCAYIIFCYWNDVYAPKEVEVEYNEDYSSFNEGDKVKDFGPIKITIIGEHKFENRFGSITHIYTMLDKDNGYKFKWFASKEIDTSVDYEITSGSIKCFEDHEKYGKAIVLTRCKLKQV